jgi:hypothetical protein
MWRQLERASTRYAAAQERARRRRSPWNLILVPLGLAAWLGTWYGLFRLVWAFHVTLYPAHRLQDFWPSGLGISSFVPSFLMVFGVAPGALSLGLVLANCAAWLVGPARRVFEGEAAGHHGTSFAEATSGLVKFVAFTLPAGLAVALLSAWALPSLR